MKNLERRMATEKVEVRGVDGEPKTIVGYGAVFNREAVVRESGGVAFREVIAPGAFRSVLNTPGVDVFSLFNHSEDFVLGRTTAGTMRLIEDAVGLRYEVTPPASRQDVIESLQRGDVSGSSFGFRAKPEAEGGVVWTRAAKAGELPLRTVVSVDYLRDVGPVTFPVFAESTAEVRSQAIMASRAVMPADGESPDDTAVDSTRQRAELEQATAEAGLDVPNRRGRPSVSASEPSADIHLTVPESVYDRVYARASHERVSVPEVLRRLLVIEFRNPK